MTTASPTKRGNEPSSSATATIRPQSPIWMGFSCTARIEVLDREGRADMPVEEHREGHHADCQHDSREDEADGVADQDQGPTARGPHDLVDEPQVGIEDRGLMIHS